MGHQPRPANLITTIEELKHSNLNANQFDYESPKSEADAQQNENSARQGVKLFKTNSKNHDSGSKLGEDIGPKSFRKTLKNMKFKSKNKSYNKNNMPLRLFDSCEILKELQETHRKDFSKTMRGLGDMIIKEEAKDSNSSSS